MRPLYFLSFFLFLFASACSLRAQTAATAGARPIVDAIEIKSGKVNNVSESAIRAHIEVKVGTEYDQLMVDRSIRSLYGTGLFDFVQAEAVEQPDGKTVKVVFNVQTKYRVQSVALAGYHKFTRKKLMKKMDVPLMAGAVLDEHNIRKGCDNIREFYRKKGYSDAKVDYRVERNEVTGLGRIYIDIDEGVRRRIKAVVFSGNTEFKTKKLRGEIKTSRYKWWWSWASGSGRIDEEKLADDLDKLREFYQNEGYLDILIGEDDVRTVEKADGWVEIDINVHEGRKYFVGDISVEGEEVMNEVTITQMLKLLPGDPFSPKKLDEDRQTIEDMYGTIGRLDASVRAVRVPNVETGNIDISYQITEGDEYKIESIKIEGNDKTKNVVILRELAMRPGQIFNTMWMKNTEARLKNTRFFDEVTVAPEPTNIPGRKNLKVSVTEAPTAQFQFGVGYSTTEEGTFFVQYTQGNFDLFNWRSFFQGAGQKFQVSLNLGSYSNEVVLSFEEPYFRQQRIGLGFELYRRQTEYESDYYETTRIGATVYLRKRLFELFEGRISYTIEDVNVNMLTSTDSDILSAEAGKRLVSKLGFIIQRDTRDDLLFTTNGSRISLSSEVAGLGGDTRYFKLEGRTAFFLPTFETLSQCISVLARAGTVWPFERNTKINGVDYSVPIFDRFFLGGSQSLRGFEYHDVGPKDPDTKDPIGGNSYAFASLEYTIKIAEQFRIAMFYDWGFVNQGSANFNPVLFNDDWGIGLRMLVMNNPLSLDYALPINSDDLNDKGGQFNFSFGTRF